MKNLNVGLVRLLQFVTFVLFTTMVMIYFGVLLLLPLDIVVLISKALQIIGINELFGTLLAIPVVAYFGNILYKTPGLLSMVIDSGLDLAHTGKQKVDAFNKFAEAAK